MSLSDMVTQHLQACWDSGTNPPGDDTAALNFRVLWGTIDSHCHFLLPLPACAQDLRFSLPFLIKKLSMLYDYPCGWNARQNNTRGLFDVVPGIHQQMALIHYVLELWDSLHPSTDIYWPHSLPVRRALSIFSCPYQNWLWTGYCLSLPLNALKKQLPVRFLLNFMKFTGRWCSSTKFSNNTRS